MPYDHAAAPETQDPRATLRARSIHERCAAARDLARFGTPDDIPTLVQLAQDDLSPAVRLGAAGAAADILSRYRVGPARDALDDDRRRALFDLFKGMDPGVNAGLFSMLACIGLPEGLKRILVGLRDPRGDVRLGAAIGLLRLCSSSAVHGDAAVEAAVVETLRDPRLKPDALAEVAWVAARVGFRTARPAIAALELAGNHRDLADKALALIDSYEAPLFGAWFTDGRDASEVNPVPAAPTGFAVFGPAGALMGDGDDGATWSYLDGVLPGGIRRMLLRRVGDVEAAPAFQLGGRTWYAADEDQLMAAVELVARPDALDWGALAAASPLDEHAPQVFAAHLPAGAPGDYARGLLCARAGDLPGAVEALVASVEGKRKVPRDATYFAGRALLAAGRVDEGRALLDAFAKKARKKDPRREAAEALLGG